MNAHEVCLHPERWQEVRDALKRIEDKLDRLDDSHGDLHKRMFVGNGTPAMTVRIDRCERVAAAGTWIAALCVTAIVGLIVAAIRRELT